MWVKVLHAALPVGLDIRSKASNLLILAGQIELRKCGTLDSPQESVVLHASRSILRHREVEKHITRSNEAHEPNDRGPFAVGDRFQRASFRSRIHAPTDLDECR